MDEEKKFIEINSDGVIFFLVTVIAKGAGSVYGQKLFWFFSNVLDRIRK